MKNLNLYKFAFYLVEIIPKHIINIKIVNNNLMLEINKESLEFVFSFLKKHFNTQFNLLSTITAVDYPERKERFEINYVLLSLTLNFRLIIKVHTDEVTPLNSLTNIFNSANWFEREIWDLFGVFFFNHPDLRRILTDYGFEGFPLRKDFPQTGYVEVRYDDEKKYVVYEPLEITQEYRLFNFNSSWMQTK